jgi:GT2 family glycosyltransferase
LVDNASSDGSGSDLGRTFPSIQLLRQGSNTGYAGGNNAGIRFALSQGAEYILVLNNDVVVDPHFLEPMIQVFHRFTDVGIATCLVYYQGQRKRVFAAAGRFSSILCTGINKGGYLFPNQYTKHERLTDFACGVLMLIHRSVFEDVGLFDESYFMYFEDVEFSRRVIKSRNIAFTPFGIAYHKSGGGKGIRFYTELYLYFHTRNRIRAFQDDPIAYRGYVVVFTLLNTMMKSVLILTRLFGHRSNAMRQLSALWKGLWEGIRSRKQDHELRATIYESK